MIPIIGGVQLDLFADSRDVVLGNDLADAVLRGDAAAAAGCLDALSLAYPTDSRLGAAALLVQATQNRKTAPFADHADATAEGSLLRERLAPAAHSVLGAERSRGWLAARWRLVAERGQRLPYARDAAPAHAAAAWLEAGAWREALVAVHGIAAWRQQPQPLAWAGRATWCAGGADAGWPLLAELAWLAPERATALIAALPDAALHKLYTRYDEALDGAGTAWFPAWVLVEQPLLAGPLAGAECRHDTAPEQAFQCLQALLRLERQGRQADVVEHRRRLCGLHPLLFAAYLHTR